MVHPTRRHETRATDAPGSSLLTIGEVARRYGVTLRALRFYEDRGLVTPLRHGTARLYDAIACERIETILRGKHLGYTIGAIAAMLTRETGSTSFLGAEAEEVAKQIAILERRRTELDEAIADLRALQQQFTSKGSPGQGVV